METNKNLDEMHKVIICGIGYQAETIAMYMSRNDSNKVISVQNNLTSLTNSKSMYSILKIPYINFGNLFNNEDNNKEKTYDFLLLTLRISLCDIYSVISSYLLHDFDKYVNDKNIR